jgi:hypothetical protein
MMLAPVPGVSLPAPTGAGRQTVYAYIILYQAVIRLFSVGLELMGSLSR